MAGKRDEIDGLGDGGVKDGKIWAREEAVDDWCGGDVGKREVYDKPLFSRVLLCGNADVSDTVNGEGEAEK